LSSALRIVTSLCTIVVTICARSEATAPANVSENFATTSPRRAALGGWASTFTPIASSASAPSAARVTAPRSPGSVTTATFPRASHAE
jgi:hypothetical protein